MAFSGDDVFELLDVVYDSGEVGRESNIRWLHAETGPLCAMMSVESASEENPNHSSEMALIDPCHEHKVRCQVGENSFCKSNTQRKMT